MARNRKLPPPPAAPAWITTDEAMARARISRRQLAEWIARGFFRTTRPIARGSGRRLIDAADLERFLCGEPAGVGA